MLYEVITVHYIDAMPRKEGGYLGDYADLVAPDDRHDCVHADYLFCMRLFRQLNRIGFPAFRDDSCSDSEYWVSRRPRAVDSTFENRIRTFALSVKK